MRNYEAELQRLGDIYRAADAARNQALAELAAVMKEADGAVNVKRMSELGGVTRPTVYRLIGRPVQ